MNTKLKVFIITVLFSVTPTLYGQATYFKCSFTLSGHILIGAGIEHQFDNHHGLEALVYPLVIPGKGFPWGFRVNYQYTTGGEHWRGKFSAGYGMLISPPDPDRRKILPMLLLLPGVEYRFSDGVKKVGLQPWVAYFLKKTRVPVAPIGIELLYGQSF